MARILITSALPYINGVKHLGNLIDGHSDRSRRDHPAGSWYASNRALSWRVGRWV